MPHIIIKAWPGKTDAQKRQLAAAITRDVMDIFHYGEESVSVSLEEVPAERWKQDVYLPDIVGRPTALLKKPVYRM